MAAEERARSRDSRAADRARPRSRVSAGILRTLRGITALPVSRQRGDAGGIAGFHPAPAFRRPLLADSRNSRKAIGARNRLRDRCSSEAAVVVGHIAAATLAHPWASTSLGRTR